MPNAPRGWIAGPYVWTYNGLSVGITDDGFNLSYSSFGDKVKGDNLGDSTQDFVYRGLDAYADGVFNEWDVARVGAVGNGAVVNNQLSAPFWPWHTSFGSSGQVGRFASQMAAPLVGAVAPGTTAANALIKNITMTYAILPPGYNVAMLFASRLRSVPIRFQALPYPAFADYGTVSWFYMT